MAWSGDLGDYDYKCEDCGSDPCVCDDVGMNISRIMHIISRIHGIDSVSYLAPEAQLLLGQGDLGQMCATEFREWLNTPQGKFAVYYAERGSK